MGNNMEKEQCYTNGKSGFYTEKEQMTFEKCADALLEQMNECMRKNNWTLTQMAFECNLSYSYLEYILNRGRRDLRLSTLIKIANGIGKPLCYILDEEERKRADNDEFIKAIYTQTRSYLQKGGAI